MLYGLCLLIAFTQPVPAWGATILVMAVATIRELEQKKWSVLLIGRIDLFFWFLVCLIFDIWYYYFR
ncbi:hypothetical protein [Nitrosovibrio sp. Nv4]|uniref:hypothetical protein n=1 Tax=Nitrosovibrio sp. Nv4 TaxID=1945880 RepID=UPI00117DCDBC|nr:hypothetical protein [Nitrosovibrio sp. Nv4]